MFAWVVASVLAFLLTPASMIGIVDLGLIYAGGAIALNLVTGVTGLPSIGNAAFLAIGAFVVALVPAASSHFYLGLLLATVVTGLVGALVGMTSWRVSGLYLAVGTLALQFLVSNGITLWEEHTNHLGGYNVDVPSVFPGANMNSLWSWFVVLDVALVLIAIVASNLLRSRWGRSWLSIRENEVMARSLGVVVARQKVVVFSLSSAMIGLTGGLLAFYTLNVNGETFTLDLAVSFITMIIVGGIGSIPGSLLGTAIVVAVPQALQHIGGGDSLDGNWFAQNTFNIQTFIFGAVIIVMLLIAPEGLASLVRRLVRA
jgi:branched-chain amino acid transport system permease protein